MKQVFHSDSDVVVTARITGNGFNVQSGPDKDLKPEPHKTESVGRGVVHAFLAKANTRYLLSASELPIHVATWSGDKALWDRIDQQGIASVLGDDPPPPPPPPKT